MRTAERTLSDDVAEKVMGWHRGTCPNEVHAAEPGHRHEVAWHWYAADGSEQALCEPDTDYYNPQDTWSPEDDISAAMQVVEQLSCGFQLTYLPLLPEGWTASFFTETGEGIERTARTAPLAICRAALTAVGH